MKNRQGIGIAMSSAVILSWAEEYYRLDDAKEEAEKRKKAREEYREKRVRQEKQKEERAIREKERKEREKKREAREQEKKEQEKAARAQLSLFDLVAESVEKSGQEERKAS